MKNNNINGGGTPDFSQMDWKTPKSRKGNGRGRLPLDTPTIRCTKHKSEGVTVTISIPHNLATATNLVPGVRVEAAFSPYGDYVRLIPAPEGNQITDSTGPKTRQTWHRSPRAAVYKMVRPEDQVPIPATGNRIDVEVAAESAGELILYIDPSKV